MIPANLPAVLVGLVVAAYWARVVRLTRKIRRQADRSANVIPPGIPGIITRTLWFPVVFLWIFLPLLGPFLQTRSRLLQPIFNLPLVSWIAFAVALTSLILTWICWKQMGKSWRMGINPAEKTSLIVTGPYAYIRHPIYALSSLLMLSTLVADPVPLMFIVAIVHLILLQLEAHREEQHLARVHGQPYLDYCATVGRFCPRRRFQSASTRPRSAL
ncbi:MAG TPA: isoprenylcysteine carboxylmethyltransferase family protein [Tepidisphaeraceae bacterium]|jgi:protein-S-isoprenylcysteine O-methyltransferase Ste14|nr:isoprenylcysteine carboxylmethyltransferase family protein [Tepidisphaeraceae bacterium]